jgi:hypothetical protein
VRAKRVSVDLLDRLIESLQRLRDLDPGAAIEDRQQLLADLADVGDVDVLGQGHHGLPALPRHRECVLKHVSK